MRGGSRRNVSVSCDSATATARRSGKFDRLRKTGDAGDRQRAGHIEAYILAEYIRTTHADGDAARSRVNGWLEAIRAREVANNPSLFTYQGTDFQQWLVLIGASHGRDVSWLREQWTRPPGKPDAFLVLVGGEWVNLAFPGLLLRLADIMDFDASRTPRYPLPARRHRRRSQPRGVEQAPEHHRVEPGDARGR